MHVIPFIPSHLALLEIQPAQVYMAPALTRRYGEALAESGPAFSAACGGSLVGAAGIANQHPGTGRAWALLSPAAGPWLPTITKACLRFFLDARYRRIEATVLTGWAAGARWAAMLGFEREGTMRGYGPDGQDFDLYARVRP